MSRDGVVGVVLAMIAATCQPPQPRQGPARAGVEQTVRGTHDDVAARTYASGFVVGGEYVAVDRFQCELVRIELDSGRIHTATPLSNEDHHCNYLVTPQALIAHRNDGTVGIDLLSSKVLWRRTPFLGGDWPWLPTDRGLFTAVSSSPRVALLDPATGKERWSAILAHAKFNTKPQKNITVDRDRAYLLNEHPPPAILAFDLATGRMVWRRDFGEHEVGPVAEEERAPISDGLLIARGGRLLWAVEVVHLIDSATGRTFWTRHLGLLVDNSQSQAADIGSVVAIEHGAPSENAVLSAYALDDGRELWRVLGPRSGGRAGSVAVDRQAVYWLTTSGTLLALDAASGRELWRRHFAGPGWLELLADQKRLVVFTREDVHVFSLDKPQVAVRDTVIHGRVVLGGVPVGTEPEGMTVRAGTAETKVDAHGRFQFRVRGPGRVRITADASQWWSSKRHALRTGHECLGEPFTDVELVTGGTPAVVLEVEVRQCLH
ncbi:PQQ-like beta-propeller repeat protein [Desulfobulbus sp. AH-315-M07]|nr:PQQ-like beta-propeller repeat protein [Desulfobulbus sp. AH-315-M07]